MGPPTLRTPALHLLLLVLGLLWQPVKASEESDLYAILGVRDDATEVQIKRAYRKQAALLHPDKCLHDCDQADARMARVNDAYEVLSSPERRERYDAYGADDMDPSSLFAVSPATLYADSYGEAAGKGHRGTGAKGQRRIGLG
jgi:curved DNA-binding protein CbpA